MATYEELKNVVQWTSFVFSICLNSLLIYLILTKSPKKMGNYRYLMIYFSCFAMFFSTCDVIVGPFIHSFQKSFCVLADRTNWLLGETTQFALICVLCGCFGVTITFFVIHFVFRYFASERQGRLAYFHGWYFVVWLTIPVFFGIIWGGTVAYFLSPTQETTDYVRESIMSNYNLSMENVTYVGALYWSQRGNGKEEIVMSTLIATIVFTAMITSSFSVVCYYGYLSYKRITSLIDEGQSEFTRNLQIQLYKALVVQAIIPIVLMYLPVGSYLVLPAFGINISPFSKLVTFLYAAYPAVDPLPLFLIIDHYRLALTESLENFIYSETSMTQTVYFHTFIFPDYFYCFSSNKNRVNASEAEISRNQATI